MKKNSRSASKIIIALDVGTRESALSLVKKLPEAEVFKIGLKLFTAEGPSLLQELHTAGKRIFLDLKLHDIPNTVSGAVEMAVRHEVAMMTLHASGGKEMLAEAVKTAAQAAKDTGRSRPVLLAVTVLTSLKDAQLKEIGFQADTAEQVLKLARLSRETGVDGIVCSPLELDLIRREFPSDFLIVTPGIRPLWAAAQDQKRIMTPSQALAKGADYIVIGRPVIKAASPQKAFWKILEELDSPESGSDSKNSP